MIINNQEFPDNNFFISTNNIVMYRSSILNWSYLKENVDNTGDCIFTIYVGELSSGHICSYNPNKNRLSITFMEYSSNDPVLKFYCSELKDADEIVSKFAKGMNISFDGTICQKRFEFYLDCRDDGRWIIKNKYSTDEVWITDFNEKSEIIELIDDLNQSKNPESILNHDFVTKYYRNENNIRTNS